jgi:hypothetical protein
VFRRPITDGPPTVTKANLAVGDVIMVHLCDGEARSPAEVNAARMLHLR